jgi:hypothetical protein
LRRGKKVALVGGNQRASSAVNSSENLNMHGATMPFSKYNADFNADLMEAMRAAFYRVCDILQLSGDREDPLTEIVVTKIVELAKAGERDPEILCIDVLAALGTPPQGASPASLTDAQRATAIAYPLQGRVPMLAPGRLGTPPPGRRRHDALCRRTHPGQPGMHANLLIFEPVSAEMQPVSGRSLTENSDIENSTSTSSQ